MATTEVASNHAVTREVIEDAVIRFAGDSGDGMQVTGNQFTATTAMMGNDLATFPDYPAEIRAPAGTIPGVSGFQVRFSSADIHTPGDAVDALVAMNPAALKVNLSDLKPSGILIVNADSFKENDLRKARMKSNPLEDHSLDGYRLFAVELSTLTRLALSELGLDAKAMDRCKNFFALGMCYWIYQRPIEPTLDWIAKKFASKPALAEANQRALRAGYSYSVATEAFQVVYEVPKAKIGPGLYRNVSGNTALALGFVAAAHKSGLTLFQGSYPITPASEILHELSSYKQHGVITFQAEDEIAAMGSVLGAAFGGALAVTGTSGPGIALKAEAIGLGVMLELPMVIVNVQRGGPSTGLPTKTEQGDLLQALFGRNGESPVAVVAPLSPADCFNAAIDACRLAVRAMAPVFILSEGFLANSAEPWLLPDADDIAEIPVQHPVGHTNGDDPFMPYARDPETLARPWAIPGTAGLEHRLGGLSKAPETGNVSYDPRHNEIMNRYRTEKIARLADFIPPQEVYGPKQGDLLVLSWGGTYGVARSAVAACIRSGKDVAHAHLRFLNPFPRNLGEILNSYDRVLIPELNMGQLAMLIRSRYLVDAISYQKMHARPMKIAEMRAQIDKALG